MSFRVRLFVKNDKRQYWEEEYRPVDKYLTVNDGQADMLKSGREIIMAKWRVHPMDIVHEKGEPEGVTVEYVTIKPLFRGWNEGMRLVGVYETKNL